MAYFPNAPTSVPALAVDELKGSTAVLTVNGATIGTGANIWAIESTTAHRYYWVSAYMAGATAGDYCEVKLRHTNVAGTRKYELIVASTITGTTQFYAKVYGVDET